MISPGVTHEEEEEFCNKLQHDDDDDAPTGRCNTAVTDDAAPCRRMILLGTFHIL